MKMKPEDQTFRSNLKYRSFLTYLKDKNDNIAPIQEYIPSYFERFRSQVLRKEMFNKDIWKSFFPG